MTSVRFFAWLSLFVAFIGCRGDAATQSSAAPLASAPPSAELTASALGSAPAPAASASATAAASAAAPAPAAASAVPVLYEVKKGSAVGYLFGTMHTGVDATKELNPIVFRKLDEAKIVVLEADVFNADQFEMAKVIMLPPDQNMATKLSKEQWKIVVDRLSTFLMPESSLARMKPWVLGTMLVQKMLPEVEPIDSVVYHRAEADKKQLVYLETVKEQLDLVEKSFDTSVLTDMLEDMPKTEQMTLEMAEAYRQGDLDKLIKITFDEAEMKKHPPMFEQLFFARNERWIPKLVPLFERGGVFVAVGAGHLLGDRGVAALLRKKGFDVKRAVLP